MICTKYQPTGTKCQPTGIKCQPTGTKCQPTGTKCQPTGTKCQPTGTKCQHVRMQSLNAPIREYGSDVSIIRNDLRQTGVAVVRLYPEDHPLMEEYEKGMDDALRAVCEEGGTPNGGRGMGGITKPYGLGCHEGVARVRMDPRARVVHASIYGVDDVTSGWDAAGVLGTDAMRKPFPRRMPDDPKKQYYALTGGTLQPHVDIGIDSYGSRMEERMRTVHPEFSACVQSQFVCRSVPRGGATLVVSPGAYCDQESINATHFVTSKKKDFCVCTDEGYASLHGTWRAVDNIPRGCLILWLSRLPHGNKLADPGVDPQRRVVYIAWQARALLDENQRYTLKRKKMDAIMSGGTTDHWATHVPKVHKGSHYSNGKGKSKVLFTASSPPQYDASLLAIIEDAM